MDKPSALQSVIRERKSTRSFSSEVPLRESIDRIIESCVYAPYGGATGIPLHELRKIFIFKQANENMAAVQELMLDQIRSNARKLGRVVTWLPFMKKKFGGFAKKLAGMSRTGIPSLLEAPYFIVVAERKGFPPVEKQSLAHALENMWLTATAEGLGFQLVSATGTMSGNADFVKLLGLPEGEYEMEGCLVGYPKKNTARYRDLDLDKFTQWM